MPSQGDQGVSHCVSSLRHLHSTVASLLFFYSFQHDLASYPRKDKIFVRANDTWARDTFSRSGPQAHFGKGVLSKTPERAESVAQRSELSKMLS